MTFEQDLYARFDRVYRVPVRDMSWWAATSALLGCDNVLSITATRAQAREVFERARSLILLLSESELDWAPCQPTLALWLRGGGRIEFRSVDRSGSPLGRHWMALYAEELRA